ncbi:nuclear transport factor 2 family protein [Frankia sp. QA3]|uniref:nuclear transport factor 2 family protein n=1 Tax=Frankia sp. QA3 TaxID=710111 RepID=UPI000269BB66|nr:nuclear transport factor 2 family protein [Frankia sp. QA3]EIV92621.1 hypothetical protein FraQA3DRAFT_2212 [Frankia sp. QA3]
MTDLRAAADRWRIYETIVRVCRGVDRTDHALVASGFHPDAVATKARGTEVATLTGAEIPAVLTRDTPQRAGSLSLHLAFNPVIDVRGDRATCDTAYLELAVPRQPGPDGVELAFGRTLDLFERRGGGWRILRRQVIDGWHQPLAAGGHWRRPDDGSRDRDDPSYQVLDTGDADTGDADTGDAVTAGTDDGAVEEFAEKWRIYETVLRYSRGVDRGDQDLIASVFHPDSTTVKSWGGEELVTLDGRTIAAVTAEKARAAFGDSFVLHGLSNPYIQVRGDRAAVETYALGVIAPWKEPDGTVTDHQGFSRCLDVLERRDGQWRILRRRAIGGWSQPQLPGGTRWDAEVSTRDRRDPSYHVFEWAGTTDSTPEADGAPTTDSTPEADSTPTAGRAPATATATSLEDVTARWEIYEAVVRYCRGVDRGDVDAIAAAFHPDATVTTKVWGSEEVTLTGPQIVPFLAERARGDDHGFSQHLIFNPLVEVRGDLASCETYYAVLVIPATVGPDTSLVQSFGRCLDLFERRDGVWRIRYRRSIPGWWQPLPPGGYDLDRTSRRDRTDPSYHLFETVNR